MTKAFIRYPGDTIWSPIEIKGYDDLNKAVGGYIEAAPVCPAVCTIYVNEEGKLRDMPPNAMMFYDGKPWDVIVGTMVLVGPPDNEGNETDATPEMTRTVDSFLRYWRKP